MRFNNVDWEIKETSQGFVAHQDAQLCVLMDIRDQLQRLNSLLNCPNFTEIPKLLRKIARKPKRRKKRPQK